MFTLVKTFSALRSAFGEEVQQEIEGAILDYLSQIAIFKGKSGLP